MSSALCRVVRVKLVYSLTDETDGGDELVGVVDVLAEVDTDKAARLWPPALEPAIEQINDRLALSGLGPHLEVRDVWWHLHPSLIH